MEMFGSNPTKIAKKSFQSSCRRNSAKGNSKHFHRVTRRNIQSILVVMDNEVARRMLKKKTPKQLPKDFPNELPK